MMKGPAMSPARFVVVTSPSALWLAQAASPHVHNRSKDCGAQADQLRFGP
jgi:hypothetical protein